MTPAPDALPLRDIHLPAAVGWWPPAPGWWGLAVLCLLLILTILIWNKVRRRGRLKKQCLTLLRQLTERFKHKGDEQQLIADLSILLRRVAISAYPRQKVAALTGNEWLRFLDKTLTDDGTGKVFSEGAGRVLLEAPYNPDCRVDCNALTGLIRQWISRNTDSRRR